MQFKEKIDTNIKYNLYLILNLLLFLNNFNLNFIKFNNCNFNLCKSVKNFIIHKFYIYK